MSTAPSLLLRTFASPVEIRTPRVLLRAWKETDRDAWALMNADAAVRQYFPTVLTREDADGEFERISGTVRQRGWGMWALEIPGKHAFAGFVGLNPPAYEAIWQPAVEIGWRLAHDTWHQGYATEAAEAVVEFAFEHLQLPQVLALSVTTNTPSHNVMDRLGMSRWHGMEFDHPRVPADWPLKQHIVHRLTRDVWNIRAQKVSK